MSLQNICNIKIKHMQHMCEIYTTFQNKHTCNIRMKKQMKYLEQMFATYMYNHCNMCNILIYFCNIHMNHLQHTSETNKMYGCEISWPLGRIEASRRVEFTGASGLVTLVGGGLAAPVARRGREHRPRDAAGRQRPHD
jgi:hypothetical protein